MRSNFVLSAGVSAFALSLGWWSQGDDQITSGRVIAAESGPKNRPVSYSRDIKPILFVFHAEDGIRDRDVTGVQTCALPISSGVPVPGANAGSSTSMSTDRYTG